MLVVYTASMPGDGDHDADLPFPSTATRRGRCCRRRGSRVGSTGVMRRHRCDRVVFGASAPLGLLAPRLRRAGARRIVALTHGHEVWWARSAGGPAAAPTHRGLRGRDDLRERVVPRSHRARAVRRRLGADAAAVPGGGPGPLLPWLRGRQGAGRTWESTRMAPPRRVHRPLRPAQGSGHPGQGVAAGAPTSARRPCCCSWETAPIDSRHRAPCPRPGEWTTPWCSRGAFRGRTCPRTRTPATSSRCRVAPVYLGLEPEAWGIVSLEAQACGLRVLIGDSGGAPETVAGTGGGLVVGRSAGDVGRSLVAALRVDASDDGSDGVTGPLWTWDRAGDQLASCLD